MVFILDPDGAPHIGNICVAWKCPIGWHTIFVLFMIWCLEYTAKHVRVHVTAGSICLTPYQNNEKALYVCCHTMFWYQSVLFTATMVQNTKISELLLVAFKCDSCDGTLQWMVDSNNCVRDVMYLYWIVQMILSYDWWADQSTLINLSFQKEVLTLSYWLVSNGYSSLHAGYLKGRNSTAKNMGKLTCSNHLQKFEWYYK